MHMFCPQVGNYQYMITLESIFRLICRMLLLNQMLINGILIQDGFLISAQIKFLDNRSLDNGTYATTFLRSGANKDIIIYKSFKSLSTVRKNETIVHEAGHALGLGHSDKTTTSVMRATGFNDKAYPLSDDIAGIKALY